MSSCIKKIAEAFGNHILGKSMHLVKKRSALLKRLASCGRKENPLRHVDFIDGLLQLFSRSRTIASTTFAGHTLFHEAVRSTFGRIVNKAIDTDLRAVISTKVNPDIYILHSMNAFSTSVSPFQSRSCLRDTSVLSYTARGEREPQNLRLSPLHLICFHAVLKKTHLVNFMKSGWQNGSYLATSTWSWSRKL